MVAELLTKSGALLRTYEYIIDFFSVLVAEECESLLIATAPVAGSTPKEQPLHSTALVQPSNAKGLVHPQRTL